MSKSILESLFNGEIYPSEGLCYGKPEYRRISDALAKEKERFLKTTPNAEQASLDKIGDLYLQLTSLYSYEGFVSGYRLGIMLLFEALKGETDALASSDSK